MKTSMAIETWGLRKDFGSKTAVNDVSLAVGRGEVFGFLGANGAGKTTLVKMLLGLIKPSSGTACLLGYPLNYISVRDRIGFLPEHFRFYDWLTAEEFLLYHGQLHHLPGALLKKRIQELLERVGLQEHRQKRLQAYSKGMLQRVGLAQALISDPDLVFLDEPTSGLDPLGRRLVRDLIREQREQGKTIFLNSHLLSEVEVTCDRAAFIKAGCLVSIKSLSDLTGGEIQLKIRASGITDKVLAGLQVFGSSIQRDDGLVNMCISEEKVLPEITRYLVTQDVEVYALNPSRVSLEDLFLSILGREGGE